MKDSNREIFEKYLKFRVEHAGAITPGQRLAVLDEVEREARSGRVPSDERAVVRLDVNDPAVQAVLRGESVSVGGGATIRKKKGIQALVAGKNPFLVMAVVVLAPLLAMALLLGIRSAFAKSSSESAPAIDIGLTASPTGASLFTPTPTSSPTETPTPSATLPPTPLPGQVLYSSGIAASEPTAPASIELAGRRLVVLEGKVDEETGIWKPSGVEWLSGTIVRKVFAVPLGMMQDATMNIGDPIHVRYRNGYVVTYKLTQVITVIVDQIEIMNSNRPSVVVIVYTGDLNDPQRYIIIGEIPLPDLSVRPTNAAPTVLPGSRAVVIGDGARLRASPSLTGETINGLPLGMEIIVLTHVPPITADGIVWVYVQTPLGTGWVAQDLIAILR
jgi:hypothetical protein